MLLVATAMLVLTGMLTVYTSSFAVGFLEYGNTNYFILRHGVYAIIGLAALVYFMRLDYHRLRLLAAPMMFVALLGLLAVLVPGIGVERNGARRWLEVGPLSFQPSEFAKLAIIVYISAWLSGRRDEINQLTLGLIPFVLMVSVVGGLIIVEPDMGTAVIIVLTTSTLFFVAGAPITHLALLMASGGFVTYVMILAQDYRLERVTSFISAENDPQGAGFHILQLLIALGSGGVTGLGWGVSRQKFFYVPGAHTDGVFAIVGEELGLMGLLPILGLFTFFVYRALKTTMSSRDQFGVLLGVGIMSWIAYQTLINIGGITRSIPLTGVPLPFLSYGGSALIATMGGAGILLSISRYGRDRPDAEPKPRARRYATGGRSKRRATA
ncbi:MAG: putative lipid II flippase FtsW [Dehalococcoidia bacterium]